VLPRPYAYIGIACIVLTTIRCVGSSLLGAEAILAANVQEFRTEWHWLITTLLTVGAAIDVTIAGAMLYFLTRKRDHMLNKYVLFPSPNRFLQVVSHTFGVEAKHFGCYDGIFFPGLQFFGGIGTLTPDYFRLIKVLISG
jgi:hypothetical protein